MTDLAVQNHWRVDLVPDGQPAPRLPGLRRFLDIDAADTTFFSLFVRWNPSRYRCHFVTARPEIFRHLWELSEHTQNLGPRDRQLLALLVNHRATLADERGNQWQFENPLHPPAADRFGVGSPLPHLWILGERGREKVGYLPFATRAGQALLWPHLDVRSHRLSNALEPEETAAEACSRLALDWALLGYPRVLLLGNVAARIWARLDLAPPFGHLEHPQYVWRFLHALGAAWSQQFIDAQRQARDEARREEATP